MREIPHRTLKNNHIKCKEKETENKYTQPWDLHAVEDEPPSTVTGLIGAVGHIHFICSVMKHLKYSNITFFA